MCTLRRKRVTMKWTTVAWNCARGAVEVNSTTRIVAIPVADRVELP